MGAFGLVELQGTGDGFEDAFGNTGEVPALESRGVVDAAVAAAVDRFGRIDVLVNNAGNFYAGYFEEVSPAQMRAQIETNLFGPMNVTRAVLPVMRRQRSGHVVTISSTAGLIGQEFVVAYAASKFGVEGWMESLRFDVEPFGIHTTIVEPGSSAPSSSSKVRPRSGRSCRSTATPNGRRRRSSRGAG